MTDQNNPEVARNIEHRPMNYFGESTGVPLDIDQPGDLKLDESAAEFGPIIADLSDDEKNISNIDSPHKQLSSKELEIQRINIMSDVISYYGKDKRVLSALERYRNGPTPKKDISKGTIDRYFQEISQYDLLTKDDEYELFTIFNIGINKYIDGGVKPLDSLDVEIEDSLVDSVIAQQKIFSSNTRLVVSIAKGYTQQMPIEDLISGGNLGLDRAIKKFDAEKGFKFSTYASIWIKQTITRSIQDQSRMIRLPTHIHDEIRVVIGAKRELEKESMRDATISEISQLIDIPEARISELLILDSHHLSTDSTINNRNASGVYDDGSPLSDVLDADNRFQTVKTVEDEALQVVSIDEILGLLEDYLNYQELDVITRRFGLNGEEPETLEKISENYDLTRERIRQIEQRALERLSRNPDLKNLVNLTA